MFLANDTSFRQLGALPNLRSLDITSPGLRAFDDVEFLPLLEAFSCYLANSLNDLSQLPRSAPRRPSSWADDTKKKERAKPAQPAPTGRSLRDRISDALRPKS